MKLPGISFIVRCHNEEATIRECITSLRTLKIPYEIVVILHRCTDNSESIVRSLANTSPISILRYDAAVSRAGYETLVTPANHPHSLITYYNYCFDHALYNFTMKWDADFEATPALVRALNGLNVYTDRPVVCRISCRLGESGILNREPYLSNCTKEYIKNIFWEVPSYSAAPYYWDLHGEILSVSNTVLKDYWNNVPWFATQDILLFYKYNQVIALCGPEPVGMARASNPECDGPFHRVRASEEVLRKQGILFYE
jgi:glycosyltransferase involved in cell wall biosynthesis